MIVVLPVIVTVIQAFQGGVSSASDALDAGSTPTLLEHTLLLAVVVTPASGVLGVSAAWIVERTRVPGRRIWTLPARRPARDTAVRHELRVGDAERVADRLLGRDRDRDLLVLPDRVPARRRVAAGDGPGARGERARRSALGAWRTFLRVVMPQLRPALLGGMLLVVLDTLVEFDAFVALKFQTLTVSIYAQYQLSFSASGAAALALLVDRRLRDRAVRRVVAQRRRELHPDQPGRPARDRPLPARAGGRRSH